MRSKGCFFLYILLYISTLSFAQINSTRANHRQVIKLMGSRFELVVIHPDTLLAQKSLKAAIAEIQRIEKLISSWEPSSETSRINQAAGERAVPVSEELFQLIQRCQKISKLSDGAFDISFAGLDNIWQFDGRDHPQPLAAQLEKARAKVGYRYIHLEADKQQVFLEKKGMKIGFGAIGKGYAANQAKKVLQDLGIHSGLVNAGGDLIAWGKNPQDQAWRIGIAKPENPQEYVAWLTIEDQAVVTSGNYEKFIWIEGQKYAHIIDPRTAYPVKALSSVSVVCPNAELADALATAIFVMGKEAGLAMVNQIPGIEALLIDEKGELYASKHLSLQYEP